MNSQSAFPYHLRQVRRVQSANSSPALSMRSTRKLRGTVFAERAFCTGRSRALQDYTERVYGHPEHKRVIVQFGNPRRVRRNRKACSTCTRALYHPVRIIRPSRNRPKHLKHVRASGNAFAPFPDTLCLPDCLQIKRTVATSACDSVQRMQRSATERSPSASSQTFGRFPECSQQPAPLHAIRRHEPLIELRGVLLAPAPGWCL